MNYDSTLDWMISRDNLLDYKKKGFTNAQIHDFIGQDFPGKFLILNSYVNVCLHEMINKMLYRFC